MANEIINTKPVTLLRELAHLRSCRMEAITSDSNLIPSEDGLKVILHLVPIAALDESFSIDVSILDRPILPLFGGGSWRYNFDGRINASNTPEGVDAYVQLFHSGIIEAVKIFPKRERIGSTALERNLIEATDSYLKAQQRLELAAPLAVLLSLSGVKGCELLVGGRFWSYDRYPFDRDELIIPPLVLETFPEHLSREMRPIFDRIWQAAGVPRCMHYGDDGDWWAAD